MSIATPQPYVVSTTDYKQYAVNVGTAAEDWSDAIQRAVNDVSQKASNSSTNFESNIQGVGSFPIQRFKIRRPILLPPQGVVLEGTSISSVVLDDIYTGKFTFVPCTIIEKTTEEKTIDKSTSYLMVLFVRVKRQIKSIVIQIGVL